MALLRALLCQSEKGVSKMETYSTSRKNFPPMVALRKGLEGNAKAAPILPYRTPMGVLNRAGLCKRDGLRNLFGIAPTATLLLGVSPICRPVLPATHLRPSPSFELSAFATLIAPRLLSYYEVITLINPPRYNSARCYQMKKKRRRP